mgnify:CR=1 FL=1
MISNRLRLGLLALPLTLGLGIPAGEALAAAQPKGAVIETSMGAIEIRFEAKRAPLSVQNFVRYAEEGHYDGTIFHRVIDGFMIQGGGFTEDLKQKKTHEPVINEARGGLSNRRGTVAFARTSLPHSATSQFFINLVDNDFLDASQARDGWGYTVFATVTKGMDVVDRIGAVKTTNRRGMGDVPEKAVTIKSVKITR